MPESTTHYRLTETARTDLLRIYQRGLLEFGRAEADHYRDALIATFGVIAANPRAFTRVDDIRPGYRRCVRGVDSIYYRINDGTVEIMAIIGRQDLDRWI